MSDLPPTTPITVEPQVVWPQLSYSDGVKDIYRNEDGTVHHIDYTQVQADGTRTPRPRYTRMAGLRSDLKQIANSTGTLSVLQLSNAVRALAKAALAIGGVVLGLQEDDD